MRNFYKLYNEIKRYEWGSPDWISGLCGLENNSREPWAELWMGVHPAGPSLIEVDGVRTSLGVAIGRDPEAFLGQAALRQGAAFGNLPFLFKLLAAAKPLSIQAHPSLAQARDGWERENLAGIAPDDPKRNYRDNNHKPEIFCALTPFTALCGFRRPDIIQTLLSLCDTPVLMPPLDAAANGDLQSLLVLLLDMSAAGRGELTCYILDNWEKLSDEAPSFVKEWELCRRLAGLYPGDPAIIAPLYLNLLELKPGEAIYIPAGLLHSYIHGMGVELMANSDNVLRGGLTPKHIDSRELCRILSFVPGKPEILRPPAHDSSLFTYPAKNHEFTLSFMRHNGPGSAWPFRGPAIILITEGSAVLSQGREELSLIRGESAFIPARDDSSPVIEGAFCAYTACTGEGNAGPLDSGAAFETDLS